MSYANIQLSQHFQLDELTTTEVRSLQEANRELSVPYTASLVKVSTELLEPVRALLGQPLLIDSGFRCPSLNTLIGGSPTSQHCIGEAVDFKGEGWTDDDYHAALTSIANSGIRFHQLLIENGCLHIALPHPNDVHGEVAFWKAGVKTVIRPGDAA